MKRTLLSLILAVISTITLIGCATNEKALQDKGAVPLTQEQLASMHSRMRTMQWETERGSGTAVYNLDGTASVEWGSGSSTGNWRVADGLLCTKWGPEVRGGAEACYTLYQIGENTYKQFKSDGTYNSTTIYTN
jgi:hypothetical protein